MTVRSRTQLNADANSTITTNGVGGITGAIMNQRIKDLADSAMLSEDIGSVIQAHSAVLDATTASFTTADETKLDGIEAAADVTDAGNVGAAIHGASEKTTPVDADTFAMIDSAASNVLKKVTWANVKATLKTYFDTLYQALHANLTAFAGLSLIADRLPYANGTGTLSLATFTSFARTLIDDSTAAAARQTLQLGEFDVDIYNSTNVVVASYPADRSAPFASTQDTLYAEILGGDPGDEVDFYIEVDGATAYGPVTVEQGTPLTDTGLAIAVAAGDAVNFVITYVSGDVTEITIRTSGAT